VRRILITIFMGILAGVLTVFVVMGLVKGEIYGRYGTTVKLAYNPVKYWIGIVLLACMVGLIVHAIIRLWKSNR
jgi:hypothetical protein